MAARSDEEGRGGGPGGGQKGGGERGSMGDWIGFLSDS